MSIHLIFRLRILFFFIFIFRRIPLFFKTRSRLSEKSTSLTITYPWSSYLNLGISRWKRDTIEERMKNYERKSARMTIANKSFFFFFILCRYALYLLHCGKRVKRMSVPRTVHLSPSFPSPPPDPPSFVARVLFDFTRKTLDGSSSSRSSAYFRLERIIIGFEMVEINSSRSVYFLHRNSGKLNSICLFYKYSNFWDI